MSDCKSNVSCSVLIIFINFASSANRSILEFFITLGKSFIKILNKSVDKWSPGLLEERLMELGNM